MHGVHQIAAVDITGRNYSHKTKPQLFGAITAQQLDGLKKTKHFNYDFFFFFLRCEIQANNQGGLDLAPSCCYGQPGEKDQPDSSRWRIFKLHSCELIRMESQKAASTERLHTLLCFNPHLQRSDVRIVVFFFCCAASLKLLSLNGF